MIYSECTKDVEEEQRKRYEALKIPAKPVKEIDYASLVQKEKKLNTKSVWGKPAVSTPSSLSAPKGLSNISFCSLVLIIFML